VSLYQFSAAETVTLYSDRASSQQTFVPMTLSAGWHIGQGRPGQQIGRYPALKKLSSSLGTPARLVDALMRQASRKMPYFTSTY